MSGISPLYIVVDEMQMRILGKGGTPTVNYSNGAGSTREGVGRG
jgi:hypothetical protein